MRRIVLASVVCLAASVVGLPTFAFPNASHFGAHCGVESGVFINRVRYNPPGPDTGSNLGLKHERAVITNRTSQSTSLKGWTLRDVAAHVYHFPRTNLRPGDSVVIHSGPGTNKPGDRYWSEHHYVWDNAGDEAILRNAKGARVDTCSWKGASPHSAISAHPTKLLVIVEENHSYGQMQSGMPYLGSLAHAYGYAANYTAISHPSLPNYLAIAGGSTFGVTDDNNPSAHPLAAPSVFDQALGQRLTAGVYAESMPSNCDLANAQPYAVRHNPWTYFTPGRADCQRFDRSDASLLADAHNNSLPNAGLVVPDLCNDAHDCSLTTADSWLQSHIPTVLASDDFTSGRLAVVITADEDDRSSGNHVLTVVLDANLNGEVVGTPLNHYSLSRFYSQTLGATPLANAKTAPDMRAAFGL